MSFEYTKAELTVKKHSVGFLYKQVRDVLNQKRIVGMCTNRMPLDYGQLLTTAEADSVINHVLFDSYFYR